MGMNAVATLVVRRLGLQDYTPVWRAMANYSDQRDDTSDDEIWLVEHPPVFTQGQAGRAEHVLMPGDIPVIQVDRGGQVTHHAPGQLVAYPLIDIRRRGLGVRQLVSRTENAIIETLAEISIVAYAKPDAPGVYVGQSKVASLGFRIRKGRSFHGLSLNVDMDLDGFRRINPCGYAGLEMVRTVDLSEDVRAASVAELEPLLVRQFAEQMGYENLQEASEPTAVLTQYADVVVAPSLVAKSIGDRN